MILLSLVSSPSDGGNRSHWEDRRETQGSGHQGRTLGGGQRESGMPGRVGGGERLGSGRAFGQRRGLGEKGRLVWVAVEAACQDLQREPRWLNGWGRRAGPLEAPDPGLGSSRET